MHCFSMANYLYTTISTIVTLTFGVRLIFYFIRNSFRVLRTCLPYFKTNRFSFHELIVVDQNLFSKVVKDHKTKVLLRSTQTTGTPFLFLFR
jgi:hypothetical protein